MATVPCHSLDGERKGGAKTVGMVQIRRKRLLPWAVNAAADYWLLARRFASRPSCLDLRKAEQLDRRLSMDRRRRWFSFLLNRDLSFSMDFDRISFKSWPGYRFTGSPARVRLQVRESTLRLAKSYVLLRNRQSRRCLWEYPSFPEN